MAFDPTQIQYDVFISYARKDAAIAAWLDAALQREHFSTWRDTRMIDPGQDFTSEIEDGITQSRLVAVCVTENAKRNDSFVRREIQYALALKKTVIPLRFEAIPPHISIINNEWLDFHRDRDAYLRRLCEIARDPRIHQPSESPSPTPAEDPYRDYLENLLNEIVDYLRATVFSMIEVNVAETPDYVTGKVAKRPRLTASFRARAGLHDEEKPVQNLHEGFEKFEGRLLLLGEPGAGKTTALFAFARDMIYARLEDTTRPLPFLVRCPSWDSQKQTPMVEWLVEESGIKQETVQTLLRDGKSLLLLDALDELGSDREDETTKERYDPRKRFLSILPANNAIVISSRITDYDQIGEKLPFPGAVTLRPLTNEQIEAYLSDIPGLWEAMKNDDALLDMARTPLLLSLMAFAFHDAPEDVQKLGSLSEGDLRDAIFERYVRERYAHEERSGRTMPFTLEEIREHLGKLAMYNMVGWDVTPGLLKPDDTKDVPKSDDFEALMVRLNLLLPDEKGYRFIHLGLRDSFAYYAALRCLRDRKWDMRYRAVAALEKIGDSRAVEPLITALRDRHYDVRRRTANVLGEMGDARAVEPLMIALRDLFPQVRSSAAFALGKIGDARAVERLIASLSSLHGDVRSSAAFALGKIGDVRAIEPLITILHDPDKDVCCIAAEALGWIGDARAVEPLIAALRKGSWQIHSSVTSALKEIGAPAVEPLVDTLRDQKEWVRHRAIEVLSQMGVPAVEPLVHALRDPNWDVRSSAAYALSNIGVPAVEPLVTALYDSDREVRKIAADTLGNIGEPHAIEPLISTLHDYDMDVDVSLSARYALLRRQD
ncbi:MAG: HEAT repeat domain-containing protein [bacterium]|nr:HEAT repeat domain-containing protein [bacterium]